MKETLELQTLDIRAEREAESFLTESEPKHILLPSYILTQ